VPTIDNTHATRDFGFESAVSCAVDALDRLHSTAESHNRVMVLEVMGRDAGWIAGYAGLAGGADVILIPEIAFLRSTGPNPGREAIGKHFTLVTVAVTAWPARLRDGGRRREQSRGAPGRRRSCRGE
jgi:6-phosphofructokinase 1